MTTGSLDKRTLIGIAVIAVLAAAIFLRPGDSQAQVVAPAESVPIAEQRLERMRQVAATVPGKEALLKQEQDELAGREKGILKADTKAQAQAQLLEMVQSAAKANGIDARGQEEARDKPLSADYGEIWVGLSFTCGMDQLVNLMAALADRPEIVATNEIRINGGTDKKKNVQVRLSVSGVVPRKLLPEKKGLATF